MAKQKKRKLRIGRLFLVLLILASISFACYNLTKIPIMNITITGNHYLTDQEVIEAAKIEDYPSFILTFMLKVKNDIKKNDYVEDVKVTKGIFSIKINIKEKRILFIDKSTGNKVTVDSKFIDDKVVFAPFLTNTIPNDKYDGFVKAMSKIEPDILIKISEIKYDPNGIDKDRYLAFMNDGNYVYLTVNKFNKLNKYDSILENVGKKNGILYLDYGDYFEAF